MNAVADDLDAICIFEPLPEAVNRPVSLEGPVVDELEEEADGVEALLASVPGAEALASSLQVDVVALVQLLQLCRSVYQLAQLCPGLLFPKTGETASDPAGGEDRGKTPQPESRASRWKRRVRRLFQGRKPGKVKDEERAPPTDEADAATPRHPTFGRRDRDRLDDHPCSRKRCVKLHRKYQRHRQRRRTLRRLRRAAAARPRAWRTLAASTASLCLQLWRRTSDGQSAEASSRPNKTCGTRQKRPA